ncbi:hypothetical protein ANN_01573 [Periplaneta americana]|uniref:BESS domain-containing protein n=1 Tax=Periplaneta americana TaxID=6978 RepID=A0ABQ8TWC2_PERAM|nr:hypothetical protein ANN_01573 [Periplaneta americana]
MAGLWDFARKKWKLLRDKFRTLLSKLSVGQEDTRGSPELISWPYFSSLLFLKDQFGQKKLSDNVPFGIHSETKVEEEYFEFGTTDDPNSISQSLDFENSREVDETLMPASVASSSSSKTRPSKRSRQTDSVDQAFTDEETEKSRYWEEKRSRTDDEGEDLHFFRSIIPHVKGLPPLKKMTFRMKVMEALQGVLTEEAATRQHSRHTSQ